MVATTTNNQPTSPFHAGERALHSRLGIVGIEEQGKRIIRSTLPEQHRHFYTLLPFVVLAARDQQGQPWATLLAGSPGFVHSPKPAHLIINAKPIPGDALEHAFFAPQQVGVLGIDLQTRRRNRANGRLFEVTPEALKIEVTQAFGNCPQYINQRQWVAASPERHPQVVEGAALNSAQREWISRADTFFIASGYQREGDDSVHGLDASHRGGPRGFVVVKSERCLVFPDYSGNRHFNTLGNLMLDPRAGLLFIDFETGSLLQLAGTATIDFDSTAIEHVPHAERLITFCVERVVELQSAVPYSWV